MEIPCLRFMQSGRALYVGITTAGELLDNCVTTEWDPAIGWDITKQGYQRAPVREHYERIGHFLAAEPPPLLPTAALLSPREHDYGVLPFDRRETLGSFEYGVIRLPKGRNLFIVDYQHRWQGFRFAVDELGAGGLRDFPVPVIIVADLWHAEEIEQFYLINSKQKRIDTDLALALLQTLAPAVTYEQLVNLAGQGKRFRIRATRLTFSLAARESGPWVGRIIQPHDSPQPDAVIKLKSFVDALQPIVSPRNRCSDLEDDRLLDTLVNFWEGLRQMIPRAFQNPHDFQIQRTVGVYAFHILFAKEVYPRCSAAGGLSPRTVKGVLQAAQSKYINEEFWSTRGPARVYVGSSGYRELARLIIEKLPPLRHTV
jgi:DGQHR domain-containing protein